MFEEVPSVALGTNSKMGEIVMGWKENECAPQDVDLKVALADMASNAVIDFDSGGIEVAIISKAGEEYRRVINVIDPFLRLAMWVLLVPLVMSMWWANTHPILPEFGTVALAALLWGGAGLIVGLNLVSAFNSRVTRAVTKAKSATKKEQIILELICLYWALRFTRPLFSVVVNPLVGWGNEDNNLNLQTLLPLQKAMSWAADNPQPTWQDRSYIQEHLRDVETAIPTVNTVWTRWVYLPFCLHLGATLWGGVYTLWSLLMPILVRF